MWVLSKEKFRKLTYLRPQDGTKWSFLCVDIRRARYSLWPFQQRRWWHLGLDQMRRKIVPIYTFAVDWVDLVAVSAKRRSTSAKDRAPSRRHLSWSRQLHRAWKSSIYRCIREMNPQKWILESLAAGLILESKTCAVLGFQNARRNSCTLINCSSFAFIKWKQQKRGLSSFAPGIGHVVVLFESQTSIGQNSREGPFWSDSLF